MFNVINKRAFFWTKIISSSNCAHLEWFVQLGNELGSYLHDNIEHQWCGGRLSRLPGERPRDQFPRAPEWFTTCMVPSEERYCVNSLSSQVFKELKFFHPNHIFYSFWGLYQLCQVYKNSDQQNWRYGYVRNCTQWIWTRICKNLG